MQDVMNRRCPNRVLNRESMRAISCPKANHRVRLREGAMYVPLIAAIVRKKIVDHTIETRPVGPVIGIGCLCTGDGNMRIGIALDCSIASSLISPRESDLHERSVIGPRRKV